MSKLRTVFGPAKNPIWEQVVTDIGGEVIEPSFWRRGEFRYPFGEWEFVLDSYIVSVTPSAPIPYTRMRVPFVNKDGFRFKIYRRTMLSGIGKLFGMQDVEVGDRAFDDDFIIQGTDENKVRTLLAPELLRTLFHAQPGLQVQVNGDEGFFGARHPEGVDVLSFVSTGIIAEASVLRDLFELFSSLLERLVQIGSAYEDDPGIRL